MIIELNNVFKIYLKNIIKNKLSFDGEVIMEKRGKLYGIGVGPGDPELITVKAVKILKQVDIVYSASSSKNDHSMAFDIASRYIPKKTKCIFLPFPMVLDKEEAEKYWRSHAERVKEDVYNGKDVAFLTVGDPLTYSTFGYLLRCFKEIAPDVEIIIIPGITSYQASAAVTKTVLAEGEEVLTVVSGVKGGDHLRRLSTISDNIIFLKAYKNIKDIYAALKETGRLKSSVAVKRCGFADQEIIHNIEELLNKKALYWTLIISKKGK